MNMTLLSRAARIVIGALLPLMMGCGASAPESQAAASTPADTPTERHEAGVTLEPAQLSQITLETLSSHAVGDVIRATGTVEFNADHMVRILSPVSGQVQELRLNVGDDVRRGDTLFVLSSREVAGAVADLLAARKDLDLSQKTSAMTKDLFEHQAASRIALQQSENDLAKAEAKVAQSEEVLRVLGFDENALHDSKAVPSRMAVRSPIAGTVTERTVTNGQFVGSDATALMTIADLSSVWVQADVFERDLHSIAARPESRRDDGSVSRQPLQRAGGAHRDGGRRADPHREDAIRRREPRTAFEARHVHRGDAAAPELQRRADGTGKGDLRGERPELRLRPDRHDTVCAAAGRHACRLWQSRARHTRAGRRRSRRHRRRAAAARA